ncbi:MAG: YbaB/EbfC family nucleoid-associated protein [Calditrichaeota bacterium]|nr:YbaB/EbfC family nucleoid-associated protein [Calditrichota bacterium]
MLKGGLNQLLKQAQQFQQKLEKVQEELADLTVEGSAGGGMVRVVANGRQQVLEVHIDPEVVDPEDVEMLEDMILAAVSQALEKAQELAASKMGEVSGGMLPAGMKLPGLGF